MFFIKHVKYLYNKIKYLKDNSGKVFDKPEFLSFSVNGSSTIENFFNLQYITRSMKYSP